VIIESSGIWAFLFGVSNHGMITNCLLPDIINSLFDVLPIRQLVLMEGFFVRARARKGIFEQRIVFKTSCSTFYYLSQD
jgi:hypothetical protein